jgi:hypothetical protein
MIRELTALYFCSSSKASVDLSFSSSLALNGVMFSLRTSKVGICNRELVELQPVVEVSGGDIDD